MGKLDHIKYITFDQLMSSVESDMESYADDNMVDRSKYIKTVRKVNSDLGIKINAEKEVVLDIKNNRIELPDDFEYLQLALLCQEPVQYLVTRSAEPAKLVQHHCPTCAGYNEHSFGTQARVCGECYKIYEYQPMDLTISYNKSLPVKLTKKSYKYCSTNCLNTMYTSDKYKYTLDVNERIMTLDGIKEGKIYISYVTDMVNDNGDLLVVDHPLLTDFYEYSIKERMLENYLMNNDADVSQKLRYIKEQKNEARVIAMNITDTPEYTEILEYANAKRHNFYNKYYKMFERY